MNCLKSRDSKKPIGDGGKTNLYMMQIKLGTLSKTERKNNSSKAHFKGSS
jgi:hypothetical protein